MSIDAETIRSEPHREIGDLLQRNIGLVIDRWSRRAVEEQPNAARVHHAVLVDHLRELLATLSRSLASSEEPENGQHCLPAGVHGEQRWEAGWSLLEVVRDYQILRLVILEFLEESLERPLGHREVLAVGLALDEAIAASATMYVKGRDDFLRRLEEKRIEENKQTQERLQEQATALQEADRRKNEFLAVLAHELRNPLAPIRNATEILRLQALPDPNVKMAHELIQRQVQQLTHMVDDLLDVSRIARGKIQLQKEICDLASIVERAVETVQPLVDTRQQRLMVSLPAEPLWLEADASRLAQALVNLLVNAAKYSEVNGAIGLTATREVQELTIRVRDTGIGIRPELLPHVFEPFVQDDRLSQQSPGGLGIGLSLVRSIVDLHGGSVQAFSQGPGHGSEFVVHLPLTKTTPPVAQAPNESIKPAPPSVQRILVVDDNADGAASLALLLRLLGHQVTTASTGQSALEAARADPPGIVLLDIGLPDMNGLEIARRMRGEPTLRRTLLIALTGYGQEDDKRRSQEAGFDAHLVKPLDLNALYTLLAKAEQSARGS
jgi:signal transduction histidine kinase/ActR/RegA family two-component response regulator